MDSHDVIPILPDFYLVHLIFGFFPCVDVLLRPIDMASSICDLETKISIMSNQCRLIITYHVASEILLFFQLESLKILQNTCTCVSDILFRHTESSFKLASR